MSNQSSSLPLNFLSCMLALVLGATGWTGLSRAESTADVRTAVGYVEQLVGDMTAFSLQRAEAPVSLALLLPVRPGDRVVVQGPWNKVLLRCGNRRITVTEKESPYVVPPAESPPGFLMRLGTLLMDLGSRLTAQQVRRVTKTSTSSRGEDEPLVIPLLEGGMSQLANDLTGWSLAWKGGEPPYGVELVSTDATHRVLFKKEGVSSERIQIPMPGGASREQFVRVSIHDSSGQEAHANFELIPARLVPSSHRTLRLSKVPDMLGALLQADFLMKQDPVRWSYQAYQSVAPLADSFEPAHWLRDCLEDSSWCYRQ